MSFCQEGHPTVRFMLQYLIKAVSNMKELLVQEAAGKICIRFETVNVGKIKGRASEIVEMLTWQKVDLCCLQETR